LSAAAVFLNGVQHGAHFECAVDNFRVQLLSPVSDYDRDDERAVCELQKLNFKPNVNAVYGCCARSVGISKPPVFGMQADWQIENVKRTEQQRRQV
jgi:hypothetical protein